VKASLLAEPGFTVSEAAFDVVVAVDGDAPVIVAVTITR
jgi:hypothetical protein